MVRELIDPAVLDNWVQVAAQRGLSLDDVADQVEPESKMLAAALRELAEQTRADVADRLPAPKRRERAVKAPAEKRG